MHMEHVEYVVVEGFTMEGTSEEEVQVEVDQVVGYLYARLKTNSDDYLRFARVSAEDLDAKLDGVDQMRGVVVGGPKSRATMAVAHRWSMPSSASSSVSTMRAPASTSSAPLARWIVSSRRSTLAQRGATSTRFISSSVKRREDETSTTLPTVWARSCRRASGGSAA